MLSLQVSRRECTFLHDEEQIRRCLWYDGVCFEEKKKIATSVVKWLNETGCSFDHRMFDHEDGVVFSEAIADM